MNPGGAPWICYIVILKANMRGSPCAGLRGRQSRRPLFGNRSPFLSHGLAARRGMQGPSLFCMGIICFIFIVRSR